MQKHPVTFLIVDDDDVDYQAIRRALKKISIYNPTRRAVDGLDAINILKGESGQEKLEGAVIIMLDLNMPRMNGHEFLKTISEDSDISDIEVFVMTTSDRDDDIVGSFQNGVAGYIVKSDMLESLREAFEDHASHRLIVT
ncbi:MAG: response regulator [Alphaproteobacteria bacterium]